MSEKQDIKPEDIESFVELNEAFKNCTRETKEHIKSDLKNFANLVPQIPGITAEAVRRGLEEQAKRISKEFGDIDSQSLASEIELGAHAGLKAKENEYWESQNQNRTDTITSKVTATKNRSLDKRAKRVEGALKVTSIVGKGLALFGQKGLADKMQETVVSKGRDYIMKDSRLGNVMERAADFGFTVADGARYAKKTAIEAGEYVKDTAIAGAKAAKKATIAGAKFAKGKAEQFGKDVKEGLGNVDAQTDLNYMNLAREASDKQQESKQWQIAHEDRNSGVTGAVKGISNSSLGFKTFFAQGKIKVTSLGAKGVALFGKKDLAEKVAAKGFDTKKNIVKKDSRLAKFAEKMAESGFISADKFRNGVDDTKEMAGAYARAGVQVAKDTVNNVKETTKREALKFGKATYKGAATAVAIASIPLEAVGKGAVWSAGKFVEGAKYTGDKILDGAEFASDKIAEAKTKVSKNKTTASKGIKSMMRNFASSIVEKLSSSIEKDDAKLKKLENPEKSVNTQEMEDSGMELA